MIKKFKNFNENIDIFDEWDFEENEIDYVDDPVSLLRTAYSSRSRINEDFILKLDKDSWDDFVYFAQEQDFKWIDSDRIPIDADKEWVFYFDETIFIYIRNKTIMKVSELKFVKNKRFVYYDFKGGKFVDHE